MLSALSQAFSLSNIWKYALTEESFEQTSNFCKILQKPIRENVPIQYCFIYKSSTRSGHWNEQNSYYSPPLVGKSHEEDTITTHFDWKKQNPILLVDRWEDQTATEDTTATLHGVSILVTTVSRPWFSTKFLSGTKSMRMHRYASGFGGKKWTTMSLNCPRSIN